MQRCGKLSDVRPAVWVVHRDFRCSPFEMASLGPLFCIVLNGIDNNIISEVEPTPKRRVIAPRSGLSWQMKQANTIKARAAGSGLGFFHFRVCCC
jgi:hypothetical protein